MEGAWNECAVAGEAAMQSMPCQSARQPRRFPYVRVVFRASREEFSFQSSACLEAEESGAPGHAGEHAHAKAHSPMMQARMCSRVEAGSDRFVSRVALRLALRITAGSRCLWVGFGVRVWVCLASPAPRRRNGSHRQQCANVPCLCAADPYTLGGQAPSLPHPKEKPPTAPCPTPQGNRGGKGRGTHHDFSLPVSPRWASSNFLAAARWHSLSCLLSLSLFTPSLALLLVDRSQRRTTTAT